MPEPATMWWVGRACRSPRPCGLVVTRPGVSVTVWWCFGVRMCRGTRLPVVFGAVWTVANSCRVVVGRREHTRVYAAIRGGVGSGRWPYALGIRLPRGSDGCASRSLDHWASWWRFTQAETRGHQVVVGQWVRAWVCAAAGRGCSWWLAARTGVPL